MKILVVSEIGHISNNSFRNLCRVVAVAVAKAEAEVVVCTNTSHSFETAFNPVSDLHLSYMLPEERLLPSFKDRQRDYPTLKEALRIPKFRKQNKR